MIIRPSLDFTHRVAYLIGIPETPNLERIENVQECLESAKQGLLSWGVSETEIQVFEEPYDLMDFETENLPAIEKIAQSEDNKLLVFLYFKGHAVVSSMGISFIDVNLESFLRSCAAYPNVKVIGLFDCCRRDQGVTEDETDLDITSNIVCLYREKPHPI